jgi:hypothetical protein
MVPGKEGGGAKCHPMKAMLPEAPVPRVLTEQRSSRENPNPIPEKASSNNEAPPMYTKMHTNVRVQENWICNCYAYFQMGIAQNLITISCLHRLNLHLRCLLR